MRRITSYELRVTKGEVKAARYGCSAHRDETSRRGFRWAVSDRQSPIANRQSLCATRCSPLHHAWTIALLLLLLSSCAAPAPTPMDYSVGQGQPGDRTALLDTAEAALIGLGYRIERRDAGEGVLTTQPVEAQAGLDTTRRASLSSRGKTRRMVEVRVADSGGATKVFCRVLIQEQTTQAHRMFAADRSGSDTPGDFTAINRDAATTTEQNTVWRTLRRDKSAEREILDAIAPPSNP